MAGKAPAFATPTVHVPEDGWAPTSVPEAYASVPYAPFGTGDRLGKCADFVGADRWGNQNRRGGGQWGRKDAKDEGHEDFAYVHDKEEETTFELIDTYKHRPPPTLRRGWGRGRGRGGRGRGRGGRGGWGRGQSSLQRRDEDQSTNEGRGRHDAKTSLNKRWGRLNEARRKHGGWGIRSRREEQLRDRISSVKVQANWDVLEQFDLATLTKLSVAEPEVEDIVQAGFIDQYDEKYDRASVRQPVKLAKKSDVEHFNVTTIDDPFIQKFAQDGAANVFATDAIMAMLAACPRSMLPWDIVVTKLDGLLFFDKRDESNFDYLSVSETASELPKEDDPEDINHPNNLSIEATMVQQNFTQQILKTAAKGGVRKESEEEHPFFDDEGEAATVPASCSYGYRRWQLSEDIMFLARTEMHAWTRRAGSEQKMTSFALNEWDSQQCGGTEWRSRLDSQRGAVLATELKNNSCKIARWAVQSMLAGADQMKVGFVTRKTRTDCYNHIIVGTHYYKPREFATQLSTGPAQCWGILKHFAEMFLKQPDGKFVIMRDPAKPVARVYKVPFDAFDNSDNDDDDLTLEEGEELETVMETL